MPEPLLTFEARKNMLEKHAWMKRSLERLRANLSNPDDVQDHFLSFAHASHLLFFYFAKWCKDTGKLDKPNSLIERYLLGLDPIEAGIWKCLQAIRTQDVHTKPVRIANSEKPGALSLDGQQLFLDEQPLFFREYRYVVQANSVDFDVLRVCEIGIKLKGRFCDEFSRI